jgi:hypothetical protein
VPRRGLKPEDLDKRLNGFGSQDSWDNFTGSQAKAFHLLKKLDLSAADSKLRQAGEIIFEEFWWRSRQLLHLGGAEGGPDGLAIASPPINVKVGGLLRDTA